MKSSLIKNSSFFLTSSLVTSGLGFLTIPIYTRFLSPSDFGTLALFLLFGNVIVNIFSIGLMTSSYRFFFELDIEKFKILNSTNIIFNIFSFFILGILIYFFSEWISVSIFDNKISSNLLFLSYLSGCMNYFIQFNLNLLSAELKSKRFAFFSILKVLIDISFSLYFIFFFSLTYLARINAILLSQLIIIVLLFFSIKNLLKFDFSFSFLKKSILFSYPSTPLSAMGFLYQSFDKIMLTNFKNLNSIGFYNFGEKFANIFKLSSDSVTRAFNPYFLKEATKNTLESKKNIVRYFYKLSSIYIFFGFIIISFSEEMIKLLTTPEYYKSISIAPIFVLYYLFGSVFTLLSINQIMHGKKMIYQIPSSLIALITNIALNLILIPKYGAVGAVISTASSALISDSLLLYYGQKCFPVPLSVKKIIYMFSILFLFVVPIYFLMTIDIHLVIKILIKISLIFLLSFVLGLNKSFIKYLKELFSKTSIINL